MVLVTWPSFYRFSFRLTSTTWPRWRSSRTSSSPRGPALTWRRAKSTGWWKRTATRGSSPPISTCASPRGRLPAPCSGDGRGHAFSASVAKRRGTPPSGYRHPGTRARCSHHSTLRLPELCTALQLFITMSLIEMREEKQNKQQNEVLWVLKLWLMY